MNAKTARMLDRFSIVIHHPKRDLKRRWNQIPWNERCKNREQIFALLAKYQGKIEQGLVDRKTVHEEARQRFLKLVSPHRNSEAKSLINKGIGAIAGLVAWLGDRFNVRKS
jgi:hypothetical protein